MGQGLLAPFPTSLYTLEVCKERQGPTWFVCVGGDTSMMGEGDTIKSAPQRPLQN